MSDPSRPRDPIVLVVDDHPFSRKYTAAALRETAHRVKQARTAAEALRIALRDLPALILTDLELSGQSGLDLVRRIRKRWPAGTPLPRVVVISAERPSVEQRRAAGTGVERFLVKPVGPEELRDLLAPVKTPAGAADESTDREVEMRLLFLRELRSRLNEMDRLISGGDLPGTGAILHQLIASSTLCGERELAARMRVMLSACRKRSFARVAASYYAMWVCARHCLESAG